MLINGINISTYGAELIDRNFTNHEIINVNEWLEGSPSPLFLREYTRFKEILLVFLFTGASDAAILSNIDGFLKQFKFSTLKFDDLSYFYDGHMAGTLVTEKIAKGAIRVEVVFTAHRTYLAEVTTTANAVLTKAITNAGSMETPVKLTIVPTAAIATYTITGLTKEPLVLKNLVSGATYVVDGYTYKYTKNTANEMANFASFEFPTLKIGSSTVGFSSTAANVTIAYYPKFN